MATTATLLEGLNFPEKLMHILENEHAPEAIWWFPGDRTFAIHPEKFQAQVLDEYFQKTKFMSFVRKLNQWGFRRIPRQVNADTVMNFVHARFRKGAPELLAGISDRRKSGNVVKGKKKDRGSPTSSSSKQQATKTAPLHGTDSESISALLMSNMAMPQAVSTALQPPSVMGMLSRSEPAPAPFAALSKAPQAPLCHISGPGPSPTPAATLAPVAALPSPASNPNTDAYTSMLMQAALSALAKQGMASQHNACYAAPQTTAQQQAQTTALAQQTVAQALALQQIVPQQPQGTPSANLALPQQPQYLPNTSSASAAPGTGSGDASNPLLGLLALLGSNTSTRQNNPAS